MVDLFFPKLKDTPPKTNMEPENEPLEEEIPSKKTSIFRFHVSFRGAFFLEMNISRMFNLPPKCHKSAFPLFAGVAGPA